jgi:hypothetical protein
MSTDSDPPLRFVTRIVVCAVSSDRFAAAVLCPMYVSIRVLLSPPGRWVTADFREEFSPARTTLSKRGDQQFFVNSKWFAGGFLSAKSRFSPAVEIEYIVFVTVCQHQM